MVSLRLAVFLSAASAVVSAAPFVVRDAATNTTESVDRHMRNGELLVYGEGRAQIITEDTWGLLLQTLNIAPEPPEIDHEWLKAGENLPQAPMNGDRLQKRGCDGDNSVVIDKVIRFVDWDVQMSPVVIGNGNTGMDITISQSYTVANGIEVSGRVDWTWIDKVLSINFGVSVTHTWTTAAGNLIRGNVANGQTGVVITRPWVNRHYGRTFQGCVGSLQQTGTFVADTHENGSYENIDWVSGAITTCVKNQTYIPLSRCHGKGDFT